MSDVSGSMMNRITVRLPRQQIVLLEKLVDSGQFPSVSETVRYAVRDLLERQGDRVMRESDLISVKF